MYNLTTTALKQNFFVTAYEKFKSEHADYYLERYTLKNLLLKPQILTHKDQPFGVKQVDKKFVNFEKFFTVCDITFSQEMDEKFLEEVELHTDIEADYNADLGKLIKLSNLYQDTIYIEQNRELNSNKQFFIIHSKLNDFVWEVSSSGYNENEKILLRQNIEHYLREFNNVIKIIEYLFFQQKQSSQPLELMIEKILSQKETTNA